VAKNGSATQTPPAVRLFEDALARQRAGDLFSRIKKDCGTNKISSLQILSHTFYVPESTLKSPDNPQGIIERLGFGIQFCKEGIHDETVANFAVFRGMFASQARGIELQGCGAAASSVALKTVGRLVYFRVDDGLALCQKIADAAGTGVTIPIACEAGPWSVSAVMPPFWSAELPPRSMGATGRDG
jgi:hypothetical protein